ncbi:MAG: hypothetical protein ABI685_10190 [Ferruginibacter sp.]
MTTQKIFSLIICIICYSCDNNTNNVKKDNNSDSKIDDTIQSKKSEVYDIEKVVEGEKITNEQAIDPELIATWNKFKKNAANKDYYELKKICLDSVEGCHVKFSVDKFISKCLPTIFDTTLLKRFSEISYSNYLDNEVTASYMPHFLLAELSNFSPTFRLNQFQVLKELTPDGGWTMTFDFVKTRNGYKFYSCDSFGGPICCR